MGETGRTKYLYPVYEALIENNNIKLAESYFLENKSFYHPIT